MDEVEFWQIVQDCREEAGPDSDVTSRLLWRRLCAMDPDEILEFEQFWFVAQARLDVWPVRDAATLLVGSFDADDTFMEVQDWIVSHGRQVVDRVISDPDSLVELAADRHNARVDWFHGQPFAAFLEVTGVPPAMNDDLSRPVVPTGVRTDLGDEQALEARFPHLMAFRRLHPLGV